ncbi:zinc finger protein 69 homolog isoform X1 [Periplaneta americana]|uniref:zinc finger protein 69 homolog isoform X1 n=1 Tax=Periplaneta americana TaxID=6978 RepID=UPI0037E8DB83
MMDVIKTESDIESIKETNDDTDADGKKSFSEESKIFTLKMTQIKTENVDHSYDLTPEMTYMEIPFISPVVKSEVEEGSFDLETVKEEPMLEVTVKEEKVSTERIGVTYDNYASSECDNVVPVHEEHVAVVQRVLTSVSSKELDNKMSANFIVYDKVFSREDDMNPSSSHRLDISICSNADYSSTKCDICDEVLGISQPFERHLWTHKCEKPFLCDVCGRLFSLMKDLKVHLLIHTDDVLVKSDESTDEESDMSTSSEELVTQHSSDDALPAEDSDSLSESSSASSYEPSQDKQGTCRNVSSDYKSKVVKYWLNKSGKKRYSLTTVRHRFRLVTSIRQLYHWKKQLRL